MKLKLAVLYGILIWIITNFISNILNPFFTDNLPQINIIVPITIIIVTGFFGILYIRDMNSNEAIEGFLVGVIFVIVDIVFDFVFFIILPIKNIVITNYPLHIISTVILTLLITTFLGYLAQTNIDLK